jgi:hypothetical protein
MSLLWIFSKVFRFIFREKPKNSSDNNAKNGKSLVLADSPILQVGDVDSVVNLIPSTSSDKKVVSAQGSEKKSAAPLNNFRGLLSQNLEKQFSHDPLLLDFLAWDNSHNQYQCAKCNIGLCNEQDIVDHFKHVSHPSYTSFDCVADFKSNRFTLRHHLNTLEFLDDYPKMISGLDAQKRRYDQEYLQRRQNSMFPGFIKELKKIQSTISADNGVRAGAELFNHLYTTGRLLTKTHPEVYGVQAIAFPSIPTAFLSILQQLVDLTYRPCPRDNDYKAYGTSGYKKTFDPLHMRWNSSGDRGKSGPKVIKSTTRAMQKTSTNLASPFGTNNFMEGQYKVGLAFDASKCSIDDQYTWYKNGFTVEKPWYTKNQYDWPNYNPTSFFGIQVNNVFYAAHGESAPQREILARPSLESVVAVIAEENGLKDRVLALIQCHLVNIYRVREGFPVIVVMLMNMGTKIYHEYEPKQIAEDLLQLLKLKLSKQSLYNWTSCILSVDEVDELLRQVWVIKLPDEVSTELNSMIAAEQDGCKRSELLSFAERFSDSYEDVDVLSQWAPKDCLKVLSDKKGESVDGIKQYLRDLSNRYLSKVSINEVEKSALKDKIMKQPYKGYSPEDVVSATAILGEDVMDLMIPQLRPKKLEKLEEDCVSRLSLFSINYRWSTDTYRTIKNGIARHRHKLSHCTAP